MTSTAAIDLTRTPSEISSPQLTVSNPFWREKEFWLILILSAFAFFPRINQMSLIGEESRRALIAREMVQTGDWVVPRTQGVPLLSRPPMENWLIAVSTSLFNSESPLAIRLPSILATIFTSLLLYAYGRLFLSRLGAFAAGMSYLTFADMIHSGRLAQTDPLITFFIGASLLLWHWGYTQKWRPTVVWLVAWTFVALGTLTKGSQAPVYFVGGVGLFLLMRRDWKYLFHPANFIGAILAVASVAVWTKLFYDRTDWPSLVRIWGGDTAIRARGFDFLDFLIHLVSYPLEILGCTLPWSFMIFALFSKTVRRNLGSTAPAVRFSLTCLFVAFPSCWILPGAVSRYFMPMYPCLAVLVGVVTDRLAAGVAPAWIQDRLIGRLQIGAAIALGGFVILLLLLGMGFFPIFDTRWGVSIGEAVVCSAILLPCAILMMFTTFPASAATLSRGTISIALVTIAIYQCLIVSRILNNYIDMRAEVAKLNDDVRAAPLVSLGGTVHHRFSFYFPQKIQPIAWPTADLPAGVQYFCFDGKAGSTPQLPFAWQQLAIVPVDRARKVSIPPQEFVVIGKRLP